MPDPLIQALDLPFQAQIDFFKAKLNLPTQAWDDIMHAAHDRAFVVAGAMKADLLDDLRQAVGPLQRTTLEAFRKNFKAIVQQRGWHGWTGEGTQAGEAWRTRVIYETNVRSSHAAGRYRQLTDPETLKALPYWRYVHNDSAMHPREQHKTWGDMRLTLRHDDPFWKTHFPPNGWGCRCRVVAVRGPAGGDATEPPAGWNTRDSKGNLPGIDKGWGYAPGASNAEELRRIAAEKAAGLPAPIAEAFKAEVMRYFHPSDIARFDALESRAREKRLRDFMGDAAYQDVKREVGSMPDKRLTLADKAAINAYTRSEWYKKLNDSLKEKSASSGLRHMGRNRALIEGLDAALDKLPDYRGEVRRGFSSRHWKRYAALKAGEVVRLTGYQSTAHVGPGWAGNVKFIIQARTAKKVDHLSHFKSENEALMRRGLQYRITQVDQVGGEVHIYMDELPADQWVRLPPGAHFSES